MKPALFAILPALAMAGCQSKMTLDEAQELCMQKGGMLMIVYTQAITTAGLGPQIASPGDCVMPSQFDLPASAPANQPPH
ncbi:MAG TPA: hypothetical protein VJQ06_05640 [Rhizomicrobium sp.]|nr:hypothetical protein [Rhizomicrobium sp.]